MAEMLHELMDRMNSKQPALRRAAVQAALALPPEQLLELIEMESRRYPHWLQRGGRRLLGGIAILALTPCIIYWGLRMDRYSAAIMTLGILICAGLAALIDGSSRLQARTELTEVMLDRANLSLLVPIVAMLQIRPVGRTEKRLRRTLQGILKHILARVHAQDGAHLSRAQRDALNRLLTKPLEDPELTLCVLKALQQAGDATALPYVQRLADLPVPLRWRQPDKRHKCEYVAEIRWTAATCLPFLSAQQEQTRQALTLLRPAEAQTVLPETLLRPASAANTEVSPEQLLRPQSPL
jgi:hypothetical protein